MSVLLQQAYCHVRVRAERGGAVPLPHLGGVLWSFAFSLLSHPYQGNPFTEHVWRKKQTYMLNNDSGRSLYLLGLKKHK